MEVRNFDGNETFISRGPSVLGPMLGLSKHKRVSWYQPFVCGNDVPVRRESLEIFATLGSFSRRFSAKAKPHSAKLELPLTGSRMPAEIILQQTPDDEALLDKREQLATVRTTLAERESELAQIRAQLKTFEGRYLRQVGILYAELGDAHEAEEFDPPPSLKTLFRDVAKRIHPDFARDDAEQKHFTLLMARANQAYSRGDTETLQRLLDDHREINASIAGEGAAAELLRITRQIQHAERDIAALDAERRAMLTGEVAQLYLDAEAAAGEHRDLLTELATSLREQIAEARRRFELIDRQISAHGR